MRNQVKRSGARILDHHPALELLTRDGAVVGANGIERTTGRPWTIRARAVVLATGGCTWKSYSLGSNVDTGDGQLMAAEVGASLAAMEFSNFWGMVPKGTSMDKNGFYGFATFTREDGTELPEGLNGDRARLARYLLEGPVYAQLDRVPESMVANVRGRMINWRQTFDKLGLDPITQRFEIDMVNEGTVRGTGGLHIRDADCSAGVPGLYLAGDVAARDRITGAMTGAGAPNAAWALSSGNWAGGAAARWARSTEPRYHSAPAEPAGRAGLRPAGKPGPADEWRQVSAVAQDQLLPMAKNAVRTEAILLDSLRVLDDAWQAARQSLYATGPDVLRAREAAAMTAMGRWAYRSALARTESRGMHYRADHPQLDAEQLTRVHAGGLDEVWVRTEPLREGAWAEIHAETESDNLVRSAS
jgi:succinate dehydrogenase/fumarate reductase flavoprotein subunit